MTSHLAAPAEHHAGVHHAGVHRAPAPGDPRLPGPGLLFRRLPWALAAAGVGLGLGALGGHLRPAMYESTTYVTVTATSDRADAQSTARAAQAMARLAATPQVLSGPLRAAGLGDVALEPRKYIEAQAAPDAPLISITGQADDPRVAQAVTTTVADTLAGLNTLGPFRAHVITQAPLPTGPGTPSWVAPAGGGALGLGVGLVLASTVPARRPRTA